MTDLVDYTRDGYMLTEDGDVALYTVCEDIFYH